MTEVYIVDVGYRFEGTYFKGVFSTKEKAEAFASILRQKYDYDYVVVSQTTLDKEDYDYV